VYRSELAVRLKELGYQIERGENNQPEIKGYSNDYLEASSPRRRQIKEHLAKHGLRGAGAAQIAAHQTRERKLDLTHERALMRDALKRSMGKAKLTDVKTEFEKRVQFGEFIEAEKSGCAPDRAFTTTEILECERDTIRTMRAGQKQHQPIASFETRNGIKKDHPRLSESQGRAVEQGLSSRDQIMALEGVAGAGKTTS
jgi:hypothetical protein